MKLVLMSAGKSAVLSGKVPADLYIDCRGMVNPFRDPVLGGKTGDDPEVQKWISEKNSPYVEGVLAMIETAIKSAPTRGSFQREAKPLTVCFFCLAGVHRSRGMKNVIAKALKEGGEEVEVK